jgi:Fur family transcriptional regulator, ferric uptake regulator
MNDDCVAKLTALKQRGTKARTAVLSVLHAADGPLSLAEILARCRRLGRSINKTTGYRMLDLFERTGIVRRVLLSDRRQYFELVERGHHHHFVCTQCAVVRDIHVDEGELLTRARTLGKRVGFAIERHVVEFYGRCTACMVRKNPISV